MQLHIGTMLCLEIQHWEDTRDDALISKGLAVSAGNTYIPVLKHEKVNTYIPVPKHETEKWSIVSSVAASKIK